MAIKISELTMIRIKKAMLKEVKIQAAKNGITLQDMLDHLVTIGLKIYSREK